MNKYTKIIDNCLDCDRCNVRPIYTADSWEHEEGAYCKEVIENGKEKLIVADDWDLRKYSKIPDWCPKLIKGRLNELLSKAGVSSIKKFDTKLNELLKDQDEEYSKLIRALISMGFVYEQIKFEKDVAVDQLNELGIQFGENVERYKIAIENMEHMKRENVMYTVCNTEYGLDARYVCPECTKPVEEGQNFCSHCGKPISWFNATKPTTEVRNKFMEFARNAKNGERIFLRSTTSSHYHYTPIGKQKG